MLDVCTDPSIMNFLTHLADELQMSVAGERVVLQAAVHLFVPVPPLYIKLCECLSATRLREHYRKFRGVSQHGSAHALILCLGCVREIAALNEHKHVVLNPFTV